MTKTDGAKKRKRISVSMSPRDVLFGRLSKINNALGRLLVPRYESAGIGDELRAAQAAVVKAGTEKVQRLADDWKPAVKREKKKPSAEQIAKLREKFERLQARLEELEA